MVMSTAPSSVINSGQNGLPAMNPATAREEAVCREALQLPDSRSRDAFLANACGDEEVLRQRLEARIHETLMSLSLLEELDWRGGGSGRQIEDENF
jgi:hypothetical protein